MEVNRLSPALEGHYILRGIRPLRVKLPIEMGGNEVDFRKLTLDQANKLYKDGCTYLVPVTRPKAEKSETPAKEKK